MSYYRLKLEMSIVQLELFDRNGVQVETPAPGGREQEVNGYQSNGLRMVESVNLGALDFMGVCGVLDRMHSAMTSIKG